MEFTAKNIAQFLDGEIDGNPEITVNNVSKIEEGRPGTLSFLANPNYTHFIYTTQSSIIIVNKDFQPDKPLTCTLIRVENAYQGFAQLLQKYFSSAITKTGIEQPCFIDKTAEMGNDVYIGAFAYIAENVKIGNNVKIFPQTFIGNNTEIKDNTIIYSGVRIYNDSQIGENCIIHSGTIIGSDGFGFAPQADKTYKKIPQLGNVVIGDNVEIGANCTIDRATMGSTILKDGVKLDNLIQVAHNVEISENTVIAAQTGISGSTKIGKNCILAGQVGISGHISIADEVTIGAQSGVSNNIKEGGITILGSPAFDIKESKKSIIIFRQLPKIREDLISLKREFEIVKSKTL